MRALIFSNDARGALVAGRTERSLRAAGVTVSPCRARSLSELATILSTIDEPLCLLRSGVWLAGPPGCFAVAEQSAPSGAECLHASPTHLSIPASATGRPLVALGVEQPWPGRAVGSGRGANSRLHRCGGDLDRGWWPWWSRFPEPASLYLEPQAAEELARRLRRGGSLAEATKAIVRDARFRAVRIAALDVHDDPRLRIVQLVTSIQIGGAERIALDLTEELRFLRHTAFLAAFGGGSRRSFPRPPYFCDLSHIPHSADARADAIARLVSRVGADVVHAHLIRGSEARAIRERSIPLVMSVHNLPPAWPDGFGLHDPRQGDLILACAKTVERAVVEADIGVPVRTVWNGIDRTRFLSAPARRHAGRELRENVGWGMDDFVILSVANPRRQKRLERLPEIVHRVAEHLAPRKVRLLLAGDLAPSSGDAAEAVHALSAAIGRWLEACDVYCAGTLDDVRPALVAGDAFVSVSAFEGLSVAQLEALNAGLPVVTTAVGGAPELAPFTNRMTLLHPEASATEFAEAIARNAQPEKNRHSALPPGFTRHVMTRRTLGFYAATIVRRQKVAKDSVWLVTNNFSTGGAQSSARRLLVGLHARGLAVSAFTIQEQPRWPTHGRRALTKAGVRCLAIAPPRSLDPNETVARLLEHAAWERPKTVFFWNVIASYKMLLAEMLLETSIYDVSPGEMYFRSLESYFAHPRAGVPCSSAKEYGHRLAGVVVKYRGEQRQAAHVLGTPVHVIPNGVALRPQAHGNRGKTMVMGTAVRLSPDKRLEDLLEALRIAAPGLPPYLLRIAGGAANGDRSYAGELRRRARGLRVEWLGELSALDAFYDSLDLFVMISEPAGCPNASLEAMAAGLPVIATDHGGVREQVIDRVTGRLVPRFAVGALAEAILEVAHDDRLRATCGAQAREHVRRHFSLEQMINSYAGLCRDASAGEGFAGSAAAPLCSVSEGAR